MIRIAGPAQKDAPPQAPPEAPPQAPPVPDAPPPPPDPKSAPSVPMKIKKVDPKIAVYMTSDMGPFLCSNCDYFEQDGSCVLVDGPIDPEGVCHLFTPVSTHPDDAEGPAEDAAPEEEPEAPPLPPPPPPGAPQAA